MTTAYVTPENPTEVSHGFSLVWYEMMRLKVSLLESLDTLIKSSIPLFPQATTETQSNVLRYNTAEPLQISRHNN